MRLNHGFTIIEMIAVVVLMGIVGVAVFSRFNSPSSFNELATKDALITGIRQAQQAALGRSNVTFAILAAADEYQFTVKAGTDVLSTLAIPSRDVVLQTGTAAPSASTCASGAPFDQGIQGFVIAFDNRGNIASFDYDANPGVAEVNGDPLVFDFNGVRICVNEVVASSVCVSPAGYAYEGNCDP